MAHGYFESINGNKSSTRLISFIVVLAALIFAQEVLWFGRENVITAAAAAGTIFITIAGVGLTFQFQQKKTERKINDGEQ
jgi:membrane protein YdbS with pleckstrin-like domain